MIKVRSVLIHSEIPAHVSRLGEDVKELPCWKAL